MSLENGDIASAIEAVRCDYPDTMRMIRIIRRDIAEGDFSGEELYSCIGHLLDKMYAAKKVGTEHKIDPEDRDIYPSHVLVSLLEDIKNGDFTLLELHEFLERIYSVLKEGGFIMDTTNINATKLDDTRYDGRTLTPEEAHIERKRSDRFNSKRFLHNLGILDPYQSDGSDDEYHLATENEPSEFLRIGAEIGRDARVHYEGRMLSREEAILAEHFARHFDPEAWFKKHGLRYDAELVRAMEEADAARRLEESEAGC